MRGSTDPTGPPVPPDPPPEPPPGRIVAWLGRFGPLAVAYAVFQALVGLLPESLFGDAARYSLAVVSGVGTGACAWLAGALLRARSAARGQGPEDGEGGEDGGGSGDGDGDGLDGVPSPRGPRTAAAPSAAAAAPGPGRPGPLPGLSAASYATLADRLTVFDDPLRGRLTGWPHDLDEQPTPIRPTATGTAYGLHIALELGAPDGRLRASELVETLWRLRLPEGGWAARSQGVVGRPEVTALVLGALARAGADPQRLAAEAERCTARFSRELEPAGVEMTHVVTTVLRGLLRAAPESPALPILRDALVDGAVTDPARGHRRCWGARLTPLRGRAVTPSSVHTAQAVVALDRAARLFGEDANARASREEGVRWLLSCPGPAHDGCEDLESSHDTVRRPHPVDASRHEVLSVRHFASAWVMRALLTPGAVATAADEGQEAAWQELLSGAAASVWRRQEGGIWSWDGGDLAYPMWMTYQGLSALRAHAVWMYQPGT
ncbi:hypothetical protein [Streptomyces formicae]|uniref:hypothetical protein n=1 Tax=Streptomyces formicae TaxID=1616117 RepID=UPI001F449E46|nr:hypothetical protein [Streptomyces formicae]